MPTQKSFLFAEKTVKRALVLGWLSSLFVASIHPASAQTPAPQATPPIEIHECGSIDTPGIMSQGYVSRYDGISIAFANKRSVAADVVTISVTNGRETKVVTHRGTFSTGTHIAKSHEPFAGHFFHTPSLTCTVTSVHFTDGTTWP